MRGEAMLYLKVAGAIVGSFVAGYLIVWILIILGVLN